MVFTSKYQNNIIFATLSTISLHTLIKQSKRNRLVVVGWNLDLPLVRERRVKDTTMDLLPSFQPPISLNFCFQSHSVYLMMSRNSVGARKWYGYLLEGRETVISQLGLDLKHASNHVHISATTWPNFTIQSTNHVFDTCLLRLRWEKLGKVDFMCHKMGPENGWFSVILWLTLTTGALYVRNFWLGNS